MLRRRLFPDNAKMVMRCRGRKELLARYLQLTCYPRKKVVERFIPPSIGYRLNFLTHRLTADAEQFRNNARVYARLKAEPHYELPSINNLG